MREYDALGKMFLEDEPELALLPKPVELCLEVLSECNVVYPGKECIDLIRHPSAVPLAPLDHFAPHRPHLSIIASRQAVAIDSGKTSKAGLSTHQASDCAGALAKRGQVSGPSNNPLCPARSVPVALAMHAGRIGSPTRRHRTDSSPRSLSLLSGPENLVRVEARPGELASVDAHEVTCGPAAPGSPVWVGDEVVSHSDVVDAEAMAVATDGAVAGGGEVLDGLANGRSRRVSSSKQHRDPPTSGGHQPFRRV